MNETEYAHEAMKTLSLQFNLDKLAANQLNGDVKTVIAHNAWLDCTKKTLFYGKTNTQPDVLNPLVESGDLSYCDPILLHGIMGMSTEIGELFEVLLLNSIGHYTPEEFELKLKDELGDVLWYLTATFKACNFTMDDAREANIKKLRQRYADKGFNADLAINKNVESELKAFI